MELTEELIQYFWTSVDIVLIKQKLWQENGKFKKKNTV